MFRNFHNLRGSSVNPTPGWRNVFIALVLALVMGGAGQAPPVQAAPTGVSAYFSMEVQNPKTTLRCGQTVTYLVRVDVVPSHGMPTPSPASMGFAKGISMANITVEANSVNKSVGDFVGTGTAKTVVVLDDDLAGLGAKFKFKANKPGITTLYFEGLVGKEYVSAKLDVKVLPCKFKVKTVLQFPVPDLYNITVMSDDAVMTADEAGAFTGSTTMYWTYSDVNQEDCNMSISAADSPVDLTGNLDDEGGQFTATATFQPTTVSLTVCCPIVGCRTGSNQGSVYPLTFNVASSGGVSIQTVTGQGVSGLAHIIVTPEEDEAVSFISGDHKARVDPPFPGWAMQWDDFSSLLGALLDLH